MTRWVFLREPRGRYCWQITSGQGALLVLQLGPPSLEVVEAWHEGQACRDVQVRGRWELGLHDCRFALAVGAEEATDGSPPAALRRVSRRLEGQALIEVVDETPGTRFVFDLGGTLWVGPAAGARPDAWQWVLDRAGERAVGRRVDGTLDDL